MTEQEYIDATDLQKVRMIKDILLDITSEISNVITEEEMDIVYPVISIWEQKLTESIEVKN
jgi:hypothetical protein